MIHKSLFSFLLLLAVIMESTLLPYPLVFLIAGLFFLYSKDFISCVIICLAAFFLDALVVNAFSQTALFIFVLLTVLVLLERVFTFEDMRFIVIVLFISCEIYRYVLGYPFNFLLSFFVIVGLLLFTLISEKTGLNKVASNEESQLHVR